jgi:hypothetical protein
MGKYSPTFKWEMESRNIRSVCGMCDWHVDYTSVAATRAHLLAHPDHIVALVSTTTTLMSLDRDTTTPVETPVWPGLLEVSDVQT